MILYYALGGGLGHLTRGRRVLETLGLARDAAFVTASPYAADPRVTGGIPVIEVPAKLDRDPEAHREWLRGVAHGAERILVDTFPCGIQGELSGLDLPPLDLVARLLRWDAYRRAVPPELPHFDTVWQVEPLAPEHEAALRAASRRVVPLELTRDGTDRTDGTDGTHETRDCPIRPMSPIGPISPIPATEAPYWLIVHSGPEVEVQELVSYAEELRGLAALPPERILVVSRCHIPLPAGFEAVDAYPATPLFGAAARIISAAGFNIMLETEPWRAKHDPLPFARPFDDQYRRAARRGRREGT